MTMDKLLLVDIGQNNKGMLFTSVLLLLAEY